MAKTTHPARIACDERIARHERFKTIATIASEVLHVETLEVRNSDGLDFHDCGVASIQDALEQAYEAGRLAGGAQ